MKKLSFAFIMLFTLLSAGYCAAKEEEAGSGKLEDVVVKEKDTFKIIKQKPAAEVTIDHMKVVQPKAETPKYFLEGQADRLEIDDLNAPPSLQSEAPLSPWLHSIIDEPAVTFAFSNRKAPAASWELLVTDMRGKPFKLFKGGGPLPQSFSWDGRNEDGKFLQVGRVYSYILKAADAAGRIKTTVGKPFVIDAAAHHERRDLHVSVSLGALFGEGGSELTPGGRLLLREASDIIKGRFNSQITVKVYSLNEAKARETAKQIASYLTQSLTIPESRIKAEGYREAPENYQADIVMFSGNEKRMNRYKYAVTSEYKAFKSAVIPIEAPAF